MNLAIQLFSYAIWFPLKVLGIHALLQAGIRRYPLIFVYSVVTFLLTVLQAPIALAYYRAPRRQDWFETVHYTSQGITYVLILAVVLEFMYRASARVRSKRLLRLVLFGGGAAFMIGSGLAHYSPQVMLGIWMTRWTRDLNFCAAVLDLALWGMLLSSRRPDSRVLLLLTGGMGIMFAGEAAGAAIRDIGIREVSYPVFLVGHAIVILADAVFLYVWWRTFREEAAALRARRVASRA